MVQAMDQDAVEGDMDQDAVEGDMDQEAVEGAVDGASDARCDRWYKRWITKRSMIQAMDHEAFEGDMDQEAVEGCQRWIRKLLLLIKILTIKILIKFT